MSGPAAERLLETPPLGIYVHLPWCVSKCPYCDFNSHAVRGTLPESSYLDAVLADIDDARASVPGRRAGSVFFGGGTPSLFSPDAIGRIVEALRETDLLEPDAEISLEANPGAIEHGSFRAYADVGVNRVSLGVQSFEPAKLARLGRIHGPDEAWQAIEELSSAGIGSFNLDLMYGLPDQTVEEAARDVELALSSGAGHLSHYQLTLEPNTLFHLRPPPLPGDDETWAMQVACQELIAASRLRHYEVSAYAAAGLECRHNLNYWRFGDYLAAGAGAHGKLTSPDLGIQRYSKPAHPQFFMEFAERDDVEMQRSQVAASDVGFEFMLNGLRLTDGFSRSLYESRTGQPIAAIGDELNAALDDGLMESAGDDRWRPTHRGFRFLNDLQARFLRS